MTIRPCHNPNQNPAAYGSTVGIPNLVATTYTPNKRNAKPSNMTADIIKIISTINAFIISLYHSILRGAEYDGQTPHLIYSSSDSCVTKLRGLALLWVLERPFRCLDKSNTNGCSIGQERNGCEPCLVKQSPPFANICIEVVVQYQEECTCKGKSKHTPYFVYSLF